jgi:hypothetical protein
MGNIFHVNLKSLSEIHDPSFLYYMESVVKKSFEKRRQF